MESENDNNNDNNNDNEVIQIREKRTISGTIRNINDNDNDSDNNALLSNSLSRISRNKTNKIDRKKNKINF